MGGRQGTSTITIVGKGRSAAKARSEITQKLEKAPPEAVAEATVAYVATTHPAVAALYAAYKVAKFMYPIVKKGVETYDKIEDKEEAREKAIEAMKEETVKQTAKEVVSTAVSTVVGAGVDYAEQSAGTTLDKAADTFVKTAVSETINDVIT